MGWWLGICVIVAAYAQPMALVYAAGIAGLYLLLGWWLRR